MNVCLNLEQWIVNDEMFITDGVNGYEVYSVGTDESEAELLYENESFEACLTWCWNSI